MTQSDRPARRSGSPGPKRRNDSPRPTSTRRGGDRRPWPTASTTTRISPAKPDSRSTRCPSRGSDQTPTPATVWSAGAAPIDLDATWPTPVITRIVEAFSKPGGQVVLLPWPTSQPASRDRLGVVGETGVIEHAPGTDPHSLNDAAVADALAAVDGLDRSSRVVRIAPPSTLVDPVSRPFWAGFIGEDDSLMPDSPASSSPRSDATVLDGPDSVAPDADLIITSLHPNNGDTHASDLVAVVAARLLRVGGILAVLTHSDWLRGELIDPTGAVVASAQNADLLYLQHIVALHLPVQDGQFATERIAETGGSAAEQHSRAAHRAAVRGLPTPHQRIHSDVLVFAQPHEYQPLAVSPTEQAFTSGVLR